MDVPGSDAPQDPEVPYGRCPDCGGILGVHVFDNELAWLACADCGAAPGV